MLTLADFKIGDRIAVTWSKSHDRPSDVRMLGSVVNIGKKRLVIVLDHWPDRSRNTVPSRVEKL